MHEEPFDESFANVNVIVFAVEVGAGFLQVEPLHDSGQLLADVVARLQRAIVDEVVVAPVGLLQV